MQFQCPMSEHPGIDLFIKTGEKHHKIVKYFEEEKKEKDQKPQVTGHTFWLNINVYLE